MNLQYLIELILKIFGAPAPAPKSIETETKPQSSVEPPKVETPEPVKTEKTETIKTEAAIDMSMVEVLSAVPTPAPTPQPKFKIDESFMIPVESGQAVSKGWPYTSNEAKGVTWHWTATWNRKACDTILGGANASRKGQASAHYCVGLNYQEGISRYVSLENRSWHAGVNQVLRWDGRPSVLNGVSYSGARTTVGVETVNIGFARQGVEKKPDWLETWSPSGKNQMWVPPWPEEQIEMMIFVGKEIIQRFPNIKYLDHHGHHDICPGYKEDCSYAFPFAKVIRGIYGDQSIPDVWSPFISVKPRQKALIALGYDLGSWGADGDWGRMSDAALRKFQQENNMVANGYWSTFVCWEIYFALERKGIDINSL